MIDMLPDLFSTNSGSVVGGMLLVVYAAITSLRKRRDLTIAELEKRVKELESRIVKLEEQHAAEIAAAAHEVEMAETRVEGYKALNLQQSRDVFALRQALAANGLPDPTAPV